MPATVTLRVTKGALRGEEFVFTERGGGIMGRSRDCSPRLPDDDEHLTVSRHHCLLDVNPPAIRVRDFGSRNGTYVNGVKIGQRAPGQAPDEAAATPFPEHDLADGDELELGGTVLRVLIRTAERCAGCGRETGGPHRCPARTGATAPRLDRCGGCGTGEAEPPERLCAACRADPDAVVRDLLRRANENGNGGAGGTGGAGGNEGGPAALRGFRLLRELGRGGMGAVFLARHEETAEQVALKVMLPQVAAGEEARARFLREAHLTRVLRHPNIAALRDVGSVGDTFFFTIEYCRGGSLDRVAATLGTESAVALAVQALDGLEHAHGHGVVHRDLSPQNILLGGTASAPVAKVGDFGLAKAFDQAGLSGLTRTGSAAGKPRFVPRQQVVDFKHARPEVDVWALAGCLYWLLTGHSPRDFPPRKDPWRVVLQDAAVPVRERDPAIPRPLAAVLDRALSERPAIGFQTAAELRDALIRVM